MTGVWLALKLCGCLRAAVMADARDIDVYKRRWLDDGLSVLYVTHEVFERDWARRLEWRCPHQEPNHDPTRF